MLEQAHISGHQSRRREAKHLPEGKIPRHDREHGPERLILNIAFGRVRLNHFVSEISACILGIKATNPDTFLDFLHRRLNRFSHFGGHQSCELMFLSFEYFCSPEHLWFSLAENCSAKDAKRVRRTLQFFSDLRLT